MPKKQYVITLSDEERQHIHELTRKGTIAARTLTRAHILRLADEGKSDAEIVEALGVGLSTVERARKKYVEGGLDQALKERPRPGVKPKLDDKGEAYRRNVVYQSDTEGGHRLWATQSLRVFFTISHWAANLE